MSTQSPSANPTSRSQPTHSGARDPARALSIASTGTSPFSPETVAASFSECRRLAEGHYENFTVVSRLLLPPDRYDDFAAIYAFCRLADDAADEQPDRATACAELALLREQLDLCCRDSTPDPFPSAPRATDEAHGDPSIDPHFPAIAAVMQRWCLSRQPFDNLLDAFEQDQRVSRYGTWEEVLDYCSRSANPVGRLVLGITGHGGRADLDELIALSDSTCTALQLTNFWQDVQRDLEERDRIYVPRDMLEAVGLDEATFAAQVRGRAPDRRMHALIDRLVTHTRPLFERGRMLWPRVEPSARPSIELFTRGGTSVLDAVARAGGDVVRRRPTLSKGRKAWLLVGAWLAARRSRVSARNHAPARRSADGITESDE